MHLLSEGQIKCFCIETHSVSLTPTAVTETTPYANFPHRDIDTWGVFKRAVLGGAWTSLNFDKEYLFGFEALVFVTSEILSMHNQLVTLQRESSA